MLSFLSIPSTKVLGQSFSATYPFTNVTTTSGTTDPTPVPTPTGATFASFIAVGQPTTNPNAGGRFSFTGHPLGATNASNTFTGSISTTQYYEVTITPTAGYSLDLNTITFTLTRSGTGIRQYAVRSSLDYTTNLPASISPANANLSVVPTNIFQVIDGTAAENGSTITLGSSYDAITTAVTFRFYGWNAEASGGTFSIDNVVINGNANIVSATPIVNLTVSSNLVSEAGSTAITVTATASEPVSGNQTVSVGVSGTDITAGDYTLSNTTITILSGETTGTATFTIVDDALVEGNETAILTISNPSAGILIGSNTQNISITDNDMAPPAAIVVNEVYGGGGNAGSTFKNDFIELYNPTNSPVNLSGWSVQYNSAAGTNNWQVTPLSGSIPANGYYLIQQAAGSGGTTNLPTPDAIGNISMGAASGKVALVFGTTALTGQNPVSTTIIDKVAFGSVTGGGFEGGGSAPAPSNSTSIQRDPIGIDTDNNNLDFVVLSLSTPKNSIPDITPPILSSVFPADNSTGVMTSFIATIAFNENIQKGTGFITLKKVSDGTAVKTIDVSTTDVTTSGTSATFSINSLSFNTAYYFEISAGAFKDGDANNFAGISGATEWNFTTAVTPPAGVLGTTYNFNACSGNLPDGFTQYSILGPQVWGCTSFGRDAANLPSGSAPNGLQINGFNVVNIPNEDWLISPSYNLTGTSFPLLSFWSRTAFTGASLQLKVSTNYSGTGDPNLATWTTVNGKFPSQISDIWKLSENINLSDYKSANTYFAFVYHSTTEDGARWTLDDITVVNSETPPPPSLTTSAADIQYTFVANGFTADKIFTFIGNDLTGDVTLSSAGAFFISKDGIAFSSNISYTFTEANNIAKTVYVRFAPNASNQNFAGSVIINTPGVITNTITLKGTSIDPATTLEVVNWNVEWFGSPTLGPVNDNLQEQNVQTILQNIGADVYGLVEVVSEERLARVVSNMPGYSYVISNYGSHTNTCVNPASALGTAQKFAFVYKTSLLSNVTTSAILTTGLNTCPDASTTSYNNWASGRYPFMMSADVTLNCVTKNVKFILVHAKANTAPTNISYDRRKAGADELHTLLETTGFASENIILLGDYNDDLDQSITAGFTTTSWSAFTNDNVDFPALTLPLSLAGKKSTVSYNDVIDHVIISNELEPYYLPATANILTDVTSLVTNYGSTTTDHYPIFTRYRFSNTTAPTVTNCTEEVTFCSNSISTYSIPTFVATDDCGDVVNYSYVITGATARSGSTNDASGTFNTGTSVITWTATDSWGNASQCVTTVIINASPSVVIPDAYVLPSGVLPNTVYIGYSPASTITLTAVVDGGTPDYSFIWTSGSTISTTTVSPVINTVYSVTITDENGCQAMASKTVNVIDIRGGNKLDKVTICHNSNSLVVAGNSISSHLAHGDMLGDCQQQVASRGNMQENLEEELVDAKLTVQAMPNPSSNYFTIFVNGTSSKEMINMKVTDVMGRAIEQRQYLRAGQALNIGNNFKAGIYFVEISQGKEKVTLKLVKN